MNYYQSIEYGFRSDHRADHMRILDLIGPNKEEKVLEIGCGFGILLNKIPVTYKVGIETNDIAINECNIKQLKVVKADAEKKLPFKNKSFDVVIMNEVIEHLKNTELVLDECYRILTDKGRIIITTPAKSLFFNNSSTTHFSEMTINELKKLVKKHKFKVVSHEVNGISFLYPIMENLVFRPARTARTLFKQQEKRKGVNVIDYIHTIADNTILKLISFYRKSFLMLGVNQLIYAKK